MVLTVGTMCGLTAYQLHKDNTELEQQNQQGIERQFTPTATPERE